MKNILLTSAAVALLAAAQANAAVYEISYSFLQSSTYTASKPLVGGTPDPTHAVGPAGSPTMAGQGIVAAPITGGTGTLDTVTGQIYFNPIDYEITVVSGSFGYVGWSQTFNGSFSGNTFNMTSATVNGGAKVCEAPGTSQSCTSDGGLGALPVALGTPQFYTPAVMDEDGNVVTPGFSTPSNLVFSSLSTGGTGLYLNESDLSPAFSKTSINITIGNEVVSQVPVPAAAWLFGSGLLGLAGVGRKRR